MFWSISSKLKSLGDSGYALGDDMSIPARQQLHDCNQQNNQQKNTNRLCCSKRIGILSPRRTRKS